MMTNKLNTLNYAHAEYGTIFWDQYDTIVAGIHENDANYRSEYLNPIFEHYGIRVKYHTKIPKFITKPVLRGMGLIE